MRLIIYYIFTFSLFSMNSFASDLKEKDNSLNCSSLSSSLLEIQSHDLPRPSISFEQLNKLAIEANQGDKLSQQELLSYFAGLYKKGLPLRRHKQDKILESLNLQNWQDYLQNYHPIFAAVCLDKSRIKSLKWEMPLKVLSQIESFAHKEEAWAQTLLGIMYNEGLKVNQSSSQALQLLTRAAEQGLSLAQSHLALKYFIGDQILEDMKEALKWGLLAAQQGNTQGQYIVGLIYKNQGKTKDALQWFIEAGRQGSTDALNTLGSWYENGELVQKDDKKALHYYTLSAQQEDPRGQSALGWLLLTSDEVKQDAEQAAILFKRAAQQEYVDAYWSLAWMHEIGHGVEQNDQQSFYYNALAAEKGIIISQRKVGFSYLRGKGTQADLDKGIKWTLKVAQTVRTEVVDIDLIQSAQKDLNNLIVQQCPQNSQKEDPQAYKRVFLKLKNLSVLLTLLMENPILINNLEKNMIPEFQEGSKVIAKFAQKALFLIESLNNSGLLVSHKKFSCSIASHFSDKRGKNAYIEDYPLDGQVYLSLGKEDVQRSRSLMSIIKEEDEDLKISLECATTLHNALQESLIPLLSQVNVLQMKARLGIKIDFSTYHELNAQAQQLQKCLTDIDECQNISHDFKALAHYGAFQRNRHFQEQYPFFES